MLVGALVTVFLALLLSLGLTRLMIALGPRLGLLDVPGERRIHSAPIPRAGGIAVWLSFLMAAGFALAFFPGRGAFTWEWFRAFALVSAVLVAIGMVDDRRGLPAWVKLCGQVLVAVALFFSKGSGVGHFLGIDVPWWLDLAIWVTWTVGIINAFNLIDGMDGLCAGLATIALGALAVISFAHGKTLDGLVMLAMTGALLGFLRYNFHPARIFLGDVGSMFIGLFIASAATTSAGERAVVASVLIPLLVAGVPLFDVILAVWRRTARRLAAELGVGRAARLFGADREHVHHRLLDLGLTQRKAAALLYALALAGTILALLPSIFDERAVGITIAALFIAGLLGFRYLAPIELHTSGRVLEMVLRRPPAGRLISLAYFLYDALVILLALALAMLIESSGKWRWLSERDNLVALVAVTLACGLLGLRMAKAHSRHWPRASIRDFWALILWFAVSMQVAFTLMTLIDRDLAWSMARAFLIMGTVALALFALPRSLTPLVREAVIDSSHRRHDRSSGARKGLVLYGAGDLGELFLCHLKTTSAMHLDEMRILGYLDDHPNLKGRILDGFRVFGSVEELPALAQKHNLHGVVITATMLRPEQAERLNRLVGELHLTLYRWRPHLQFTQIGAHEVREQPAQASSAIGS